MTAWKMSDTYEDTLLTWKVTAHATVATYTIPPIRTHTDPQTTITLRLPVKTTAE